MIMGRKTFEAIGRPLPGGGRLSSRDPLGGRTVETPTIMPRSRGGNSGSHEIMVVGGEI